MPVSVFRIVLIALAGLIVVATALSLVRTDAWWVRMFDFPRMQLTVAAIVVVALYVGSNLWLGDPSWWEWGLFAALAVAVGVQGTQMVPYTSIYPEQTVRANPADAAPDRRLRLVVSNVLMENRDRDRWLEVVREADPDIIAAVETDAWWVETSRELADAYPHAVEVPQDDTYGMLLRSKLPLDRTEVRHLVEDTVPSLLLTVRLRSGEPVTVILLHPRPPRPDIQQDATLRDAELVLAGREAAEEKGPIVVAGDLNDVAWSHTTRLFQRLSGLLDPRIGRGTFSTFHAEHWWLRYPLDHVFHSDHFALVELRRLDPVGSDHFPMLIELELDPSVVPLQEAPETEADDVEEGADMVDEAEEMKAEETPEERREREEEDQ
ncbi:endonuclease/exonuclease/phosphatase family protein [Rubrivirga sp. SAORIC476]|uniref:endonuclease/exonuclease/phosphatase family protein n=1 Tax=Rubrivirga sp. SAORIC476 TaxID=1961794 RepID=UPI001179B36E|nr:endonuclease/exonuclease/phosphatase family protein [Rubrivirga sp. SAORIC476]